MFEVLLRTSKLFKMAFNRQVLPAPIGPTIPIKSPFSIVNFMSFNNSIISISGIFSSDFIGSLTSNVIISLSLFSFFSSLSFLFSLFDVFIFDLLLVYILVSILLLLDFCSIITKSNYIY